MEESKFRQFLNIILFIITKQNVDFTLHYMDYIEKFGDFPFILFQVRDILDMRKNFTILFESLLDFPFLLLVSSQKSERVELNMMLCEMSQSSELRQRNKEGEPRDKRQNWQF